jgi:hypothetical protein
MSQSESHIGFSAKWRGWIEAVRRLWKSEMDHSDRAQLEHYRSLTEPALSSISETSFVAEIHERWLALKENPQSTVAAELFLGEVEVHTTAIDAAMPMEESLNVPDVQRRELLADVKVVLESLKDLLEDLPFWAKAVITAVCEVAELLKRK